MRVGQRDRAIRDPGGCGTVVLLEIRSQRASIGPLDGPADRRPPFPSREATDALRTEHGAMHAVRHAAASAGGGEKSGAPLSQLWDCQLRASGAAGRRQWQLRTQASQRCGQAGQQQAASDSACISAEKGPGHGATASAQLALSTKRSPHLDGHAPLWLRLLQQVASGLQ